LLSEAFEKCGNIKEIRPMHNRDGKFKGFAYIEFSDEESAKKAMEIAENGIKIGGNKAMVSYALKLDPGTVVKTRGKKQFSDELTLFIKNLSDDTTKEDLSSHVGAVVEVRSVRLVLNRDGTSRGIAYVSVNDDESLQKAIETLNGKELQGKPLSIEKSAPPRKEINKKLDFTPPEAKEKPKSKIGLVPASVRRRKV